VTSADATAPGVQLANGSGRVHVAILQDFNRLVWLSEVLLVWLSEVLLAWLSEVLLAWLSEVV
jgi:hypothetical protein